MYYICKDIYQTSFIAWFTTFPFIILKSCYTIWKLVKYYHIISALNPFSLYWFLLVITYLCTLLYVYILPLLSIQHSYGNHTIETYYRDISKTVWQVQVKQDVSNGIWDSTQTSMCQCLHSSTHDQWTIITILQVTMSECLLSYCYMFRGLLFTLIHNRDNGWHLPSPNMAL